MLNAQLFLRYKLHHLFIWMLVFGIWFFLRENDYARSSTAFVVTFIKVGDLALMIYVTNYLFIPLLLYKKHYLWFALAFAGMIVASSIIKMYVLGRYLNAPTLLHWSDNIKGSIYNNILPHFFLVTAGAAVKLMLDNTRLQKRMAETAREKAEAELNFLKSQINPHFVFNSLNSVYFLIHRDNTQAREALHKFSEMLRYQLYEMNGEKVPIEKEITYLKDYMDLQQLRKDEKYAVQFHCNDSVAGFSIEPLLLIPLVENAFKHVSHHSDRKNFVKVDLNRENGSFQFGVENSKESMPTTEKHGGIGLQNVKRRLELLYPGKYTLSITETTDQFSVKLNISLS